VKTCKGLENASAVIGGKRGEKSPKFRQTKKWGKYYLPWGFAAGEGNKGLMGEVVERRISLGATAPDWRTERGVTVHQRQKPVLELPEKPTSADQSHKNIQRIITFYLSARLTERKKGDVF